MNVVILMGRLTAAPEIRQTDSTTVASYTLAVDRIGKDKGADFIRCKAFGKSADFAEKYLKKGLKIAVEGRISTGSYTNKEGQKVYTTDVIVNAHHFAESKGEAAPSAPPTPDDYLNVPGNIDDEVPFV
jgi:single-strand DNA-binding protein